MFALDDADRHRTRSPRGDLKYASKYEFLYEMDRPERTLDHVRPS